MNVELSVQKAKRTAVALRPSTVSASPEPSTLPKAATNGHDSENSGTPETDARSARERSIAILNLPDTVNLARLEKLLEPFGSIKKLQLRPDYGGAIVEFTEVQSAGKVSLALDEHELDGRHITFGTVAELLKHGKPMEKGQEKKITTTRLGLGSGVVSRPTPGAKRGGLGKQSRPKGESGKESGAKSNADFRAMFLKGKEEDMEILNSDNS
jgi:hypothetical protein